MAGHPDFYLASSEHGGDLAEPRKVWCIKRMRGDHWDDFLLVRVDPPLWGGDQPGGVPARYLDKLVLATRHFDASLFPIRKWPVYVFVMVPLVDDVEQRDVIHDDEAVLLAWAELYRTERAARRKAM